MDSSAVYVSADWHSAERWSLGPGVRYSHFDIQLPADSNRPSAQLSPDDFTGDFRLVYQLSANTNLVGNLGRGFRPPNIFDLSTLGNRPGNRFNIANPALQAESVLSYDIGVKTSTENWQSELFIFKLDYRDKISSVPTGEITDSGSLNIKKLLGNFFKTFGARRCIKACYLFSINFDR